MILNYNNYSFFSNDLNFNYGVLISSYKNVNLFNGNLKNDFFLNHKDYNFLFQKKKINNVYLPLFFYGMDAYYTNRVNYFFPFRGLRVLMLLIQEIFLRKKIVSFLSLENFKRLSLLLFFSIYNFSPKLNFLLKKSSFIYSKKTKNINSFNYFSGNFYKPLLTQLLIQKKLNMTFFLPEFLIYNNLFLKSKRFYGKLFKKNYKKTRNRLYRIKFNKRLKVQHKRSVIYKKLSLLTFL
jgi:hypothetical protein